MLIRRQGICTSEKMERRKRLKVHPEIAAFPSKFMNQIAKPLQFCASITSSSFNKSKPSLDLASFPPSQSPTYPQGKIQVPDDAKRNLGIQYEKFSQAQNMEKYYRACSHALLWFTL